MCKPAHLTNIPALHLSPLLLQVFDSQTLALFTSSLFLAGLFTAPVASIVTRKYGRKLTMLCAGIAFLIGSVLNAAAQNLGMLIAGRIMLGIGALEWGGLGA